MELQQGLSTGFLVVFGTVLLLTVLALITAIILSLKPELSPHQMRLFDICCTTWQMGFGAIVGLIGGKVF